MDLGKRIQFLKELGEIQNLSDELPDEIRDVQRELVKQIKKELGLKVD